MIISKQNRRTIYMALFQEGVLVAPKNFEIKHPNLDVPNLEAVSYTHLTLPTTPYV